MTVKETLKDPGIKAYCGEHVMSNALGKSANDSKTNDESPTVSTTSAKVATNENVILQKWLLIPR